MSCLLRVCRPADERGATREHAPSFAEKIPFSSRTKRVVGNWEVDFRLARDLESELDLVFTAAAPEF
jgi:hypothetical protein